MNKIIGLVAIFLLALSSFIKDYGKIGTEGIIETSGKHNIVQLKCIDTKGDFFTIKTKNRKLVNYSKNHNGETVYVFYKEMNNNLVLIDWLEIDRK